MSLHETDHPLLSRILGRSRSIFQDDVESNIAALTEALRGARILVIGAAGAIGGAFVRQLTSRGSIRALHLIDISENGLVEVVRDLRSSSCVLDDLRTFAIDLRGYEFGAFMNSGISYDYIINFAALKHVRAERDPFTLARMIDTNVLAVWRLLDYLEGRRFFSVSSDKSVRPANLMGASKALMEKVMWAHSDRTSVSTARFANVAFSAGSLLDGFTFRLQKRQALAAPLDTRRYFISHEEAAHLCLLAAFLGNNREAFVPRFEDASCAKTFSDIALEFLRFHGYEPVVCQSEEEARSLARSLANPSSRFWPCYFSASDTAGEKEIEEFLLPNDRPDNARFLEVQVIQQPFPADRLQFLERLARLSEAVSDPSLDDLRLRLQDLVPSLQHVVRDKHLDSKM